MWHRTLDGQMKRGILVATLVMTVAGVASANLLTTGPQGVASPLPPAQPATEATRPVTKVVAEKTAPAPAPAASISAPAATKAESAATRAAIEADGYKGVKVLRKGVNGVWHASAMRGNATVMLTVDSSGSVSA